MGLTVHTLALPMSCAYLIEGDGGLWLVDAGAPHCEAWVLRRLDALGRRDLRAIFITHGHGDHYGSAAALRRATGAAVAIHRADAHAMAQGRSLLGMARGRGRLGAPVLRLLEALAPPEPTRADLLLEDGDRLDALGLDALVVHTPGHTAGSACLLVEGRWLFAGDLLTSTPRPALQRYYAHDWSQLAPSLRRVQALRPSLTYPGHGLRPLDVAELLALSGPG